MTQSPHKMSFVNPKNDVAFKKIFGSEDKTDILIAFLNAVLDLHGDNSIQQVQLLHPYQAPRLANLKVTLLDIKATDNRGITFIVEMQVEHVASVKKRFAYYLAKAYSSQIKRGEDYPKLNQVIFIGVLDFKLFENNKHHLSQHQFLDTTTHSQEIEELEFVFIELPKFKKKEADLGSFLDKWIYFIKHAPDLEFIPAHVQEPELRAAYEVADQFSWSQEDLDAYDNRGVLIQDARGALEYAEQVGEQRGEQRIMPISGQGMIPGFRSAKKI